MLCNRTSDHRLQNNNLTFLDLSLYVSNKSIHCRPFYADSEEDTSDSFVSVCLCIPCNRQLAGANCTVMLVSLCLFDLNCLIFSQHMSHDNFIDCKPTQSITENTKSYFHRNYCVQVLLDMFIVWQSHTVQS